MALGMLLGGLRSGEIRSLRLADIDFGLRRVRVVGKGGKVVPVDSDFFTETSRYLREERPAGGWRRSFSWCCADRPAGSRWVRRRCGGSSAPIASWPGRRGSVRIGCGTPTAPSSLPRGSTCWCYVT